ncbi:MAG: hypothetical protein QW520_08620 [Methanomassiliicoccales archaeon]
MRVKAGWGYVEIDDKSYEGDIVVHVDGTVTKRQTYLSFPYRSEFFHVPLSEKELDFLENENPEVVYVGAGHKGMLSLTPNAKKVLSEYELKIMLTEAVAVAISQEKRRMVAFIHTTC